MNFACGKEGISKELLSRIKDYRTKVKESRDRAKCNVLSYLYMSN